MAKLNTGKYTTYHYELYIKHDLSYRAREVFSVIYRQCMNFHDNGWFGYSDFWLAKELNMSKATVTRALTELREKEFITVESIGCRRKDGSGRKIFVNAKHFITEEDEPNTTDSTTELNEALQDALKQVDELTIELEKIKLEKAKNTHISYLGQELINTGFITEDEYKQYADDLNHDLREFHNGHKGGHDLSKKCFTYWYQHKSATKINNYVAYINSCIQSSKKWLHKRYEQIAETQKERLKREIEGAVDG